ncbi:MAG: hypothetical protein II559_03225, partial [Muribaculaceae bacterium]|nr:hypothetical protein [Muribaculaceae bacterium]
MCFVVNSIFSRIKDNHFLRETQSYYHLFESLFSLALERNENKNALFSRGFSSFIFSGLSFGTQVLYL